MMKRDVFQTIADPTRRKIFDLLMDRELPVNEVADHFEISRPAISKHIKILHESGLVRIKQEGRQRICSAEGEKIREVAAWANRYRAFWEGKLDVLESELKKEDVEQY